MHLDQRPALEHGLGQPPGSLTGDINDPVIVKPVLAPHGENGIFTLIDASAR